MNGENVNYDRPSLITQSSGLGSSTSAPSENRCGQPAGQARPGRVRVPEHLTWERRDSLSPAGLQRQPASIVPASHGNGPHENL